MSSELTWLGRQACPVLSLLIVNLVCMVVGSGLSLLDPLVVKWLIDVALAKRDLRLVLFGTLVFCGVYLASVIVSYLASFISCIVTQKMVFRIRVSLLRRIHALPARYHGNSQVGETLYRIEQDVDRVAELSGDILPLTIQMLIMGVMVLVTMGILNWRLTLVIAPLLPVFYVLQRLYASRLSEAADSVQGQSGKIGAFLQEHLAGMLQLQLLNRTGTQGRKFARLAAEGAKFQVRQRALEMSFGAASISVIVLGMGLILGYGGYEVTRGALTVGGLVAFYGYVFRLFAPVSIAIDLQSRLQRVGASVRRILEITDGDPQVAGLESMPHLVCDTTPELEFRSVWFCYDESRPVLRDMSFRIEAGETVAVVGLNGSGKSTIGLLATRLYEPNAGLILVGGQNIRQVGRRSLRAIVTLVPQDPVLFDETVRDNLLYGNPRATGKDLETVATLTQLDRVLQRLPKGLDEPLGPLGGRLSGGEKKRLALARTLLQQPRILIVDEITSALDGPAAAGLLQGLELFRQARTLVVISHRPATILWADRILVVDEGAIVDSGRHDELSLRCEAYRRIWQSQDGMASLRSQPVVWSGTTARSEVPPS
ncbi:MAG TPA: ABC transporter ATP-binding protein [Terriglobales bacterium]|jgi:ATP-binding cassette subfamily B protein|nr:ABC transporter ATP-binding protein [Terriglobales bacterium]